MAATVEQLLKRLVDSGLWSADEAGARRASIVSSGHEGTAESVGRELIKEGRLTKFQLQHLFSSRPIPLVLGNYVLVDRVGSGGMGQVFKAEHRRMKRIVALKVLPSAMMRDAQAVHRFQREVQAAARLTHPNIVTAYDADESRGVHYFVMEYVDGEDLANLVRRHGARPADEAIQISMQAARGLEYAHSQGIIHRDIKPSNLLLDKRGTVKILDMGLARIEGPGNESSGGLTNTGMVMGTVDYMSPEQALDTKHADSRSDIYSLGCTLFYLLAGRPPFGGDTVMKKLLAHRESHVPALSGVIDPLGSTPDLKLDQLSRLAALDAVLQRMLAKDPLGRLQSMREVLHELDRALGATAASAIPSSSVGGPVFPFAPPVRREAHNREQVEPFFPAPETRPAAEVDTSPSIAFEGTLANLAADLRQPGAPGRDSGIVPRSKRFSHSGSRSKLKRWHRSPWLFPALATAVGIVLLLAIMISGKPVAKPTVATTTEPTVEDDAEEPATSSETLNSTLTDAQRELARFLIQDLRARVAVIEQGETNSETYDDAEKLPQRTFTISGVTFNGQRPPTAANLERLSDAPRLNSLNLDGCGLTDAQLEAIPELPIVNLYVGRSRLTEAGLQRLAKISSLGFIQLRGQTFSQRDVTALSRALPRCRIDWDGGMIDPSKRPLTMPATASASSGGWQMLFDGKGTSQWATLNGFRVVDGFLTATGPSLALTARDFEDFELEFEWRVSRGGEGGVIYWLADGGAKPGAEYQLLDDANHDDGKVADRSAAALFGIVAPAFNATRPAGQINSGRIICNGPLVEHWLNGVLVLSYDRQSAGFRTALDASRMPFPEVNKRLGRIALQSTTGTISFKSIRVRSVGSEVGSVPPSSGTPGSDGFVDLFNGRDLTGWEIKGGGKWRVADGTVMAETLTAEGVGSLMTEREFGDYVLELEYQISSGGDSGVFPRAFPDGSLGGGDFTEVQIIDEASPIFADLAANRRTGAVVDMVTPNVAARSPAGQWNRMRIEAQGRQLVVTINGVEVTRGIDSEMPLRGRIALQLYPGRVAFRNIRVRDSGATTTAPQKHVLMFDGIDDFAEISSWEYDGQPVTIEAWVTADDQAEPQNLVTWLGPRWLALWRSEGKWGVGIGGQGGTTLLQSRDRSPGSLRTHVAGVWKGDHLMKLFVNGRPMPIQALQAEFLPGDKGLYIGGVRRGKLPHEGSRFFAGGVEALRIRSGTKFAVAFTPDQTFEPDSETLLLLDSTMKGRLWKDGSGNNRDAVIVGAKWSETSP